MGKAGRSRPHPANREGLNGLNLDARNGGEIHAEDPAELGAECDGGDETKGAGSVREGAGHSDSALDLTVQPPGHDIVRAAENTPSTKSRYLYTSG